MEIIGLKDKDFVLSICSIGSSPFVLQGESAEIIVKTEKKSKIEIFINGKEIKPYNIFGDESAFKADFCFEKAGESMVEVYSSSECLFSQKIFAYIEDNAFKDCYFSMKSFIREVIKDEAESVFSKFMPEKRKLLITVATRRFLNIFKRAKKDNAEDGLLKFRMAKMIELEKKLLGSSSGFEHFISDYPFRDICENEDPKFKVPQMEAGFFEEDPLNIKNMYKFFGFMAIYKILKDNFNGGETKFLEETENGVLFDIHRKRSIAFFNTESETKIRLLYDPKDDFPEVILKTTKVGHGEERTRIYAFESIFTKDFDKAYSLLCKRKHTLTEKESKTPLLYDAISLYIGEREEENVISLLPERLSSLENYIKTILNEDRNQFFTPEELSDGISREDFENKSVCVAVCKTKSQFNLNLREKFYFIPQRYMESDFVSHIALYQSRNLFGEDAGISYIGEVKKISLVPRYKIEEIPSNNDEMYYRYDIKEWRKLERKIKPKAFGGVCMLTSMALIEKASYTNELGTPTYEEYILHLAGERLKEKNEVLFKLGRNFYKMTRENTTIYTSEGEIIKRYETSPY